MKMTVCITKSRMMLKKLLTPASIAAFVLFAVLFNAISAQMPHADVDAAEVSVEDTYDSVKYEGASVSSNSIEAESAEINLAAQWNETLKNDMVIRLTQPGLDFLSKVIKIMLIGFVRESDYPGKAADTVPAAIQSGLSGLWTSLDLSMTAVCRSGCIHFYPRWPRYSQTFGADGNINNAQICNCNLANSNGYTFNGVALGSCDNCLPDVPGYSGANGNWYAGSANNTALGGGWPGVISIYNDPYDPDPDPFTPKKIRWMKPPYYKEAIEYQKFNYNAYTNADMFSGTHCVVNPNGTYKGNCDPYSPKVGIYPNGDKLEIKLMLFNLLIHGQIGVDGGWLCVLDTPWGGDAFKTENSPAFITLLNNNHVYAKLTARFQDGYTGMLGQDGTAPPSGGGGTPPPTSSPCPESTSGGNNPPPDPPPPTPVNISNDPILDLAAGIVGGSAKNGSCWTNNAGDFCTSSDYDINTGEGIIDDIVSLIQGLLTGLISDAIKDALNDQLGPLLADTMGLPLDFNQLFAGQSLTGRLGLCGLTIDGTDCAHGSKTCACDDYDSDGLLNYQDTADVPVIEGWDYTQPGPYTLANMWHENDYGVGSSIGGWIDLLGNAHDAPSYDLGAYLEVNYPTPFWNATKSRWDGGGVNIVVDFAMTPIASTVIANSCFAGDLAAPGTAIFEDPTQVDHSTTTRRDAYSAGSFLDFDNVVMDNDGADDSQHLIIGTSQYVLEEVINGFNTSGLLCMVVDQNFLGGLGDMLKISNFKSIVPALNNQAIFNQDDAVKVLLRPTGVPTVRVLGGRTGAAWPAGDCIPNDGARIHTEGTGLELHKVDNLADLSCAGHGGNNQLYVYDLAIVIPDYQVEFWAPYMGDQDNMKRLFHIKTDLVLAAAIEYTRNGATTLFGKNYRRYLEILIEPWLGCGGTILATGGTSYAQECLFESDDPAVTADFQLQKGVSSLLVTLLNTHMGLLLRTAFNIAGLTLEFGKIGAYPPVYNTLYDLDDNYGNTYHKYGNLGNGTNDYLGISAVFGGALEFSKIFGLLSGALAPAPYMVEPETYLIPEGPLISVGSQGHTPGTWFNLTPSESAMLGIRAEKTKFLLDGAPAVAKYDQTTDDLRYSYRYDGGTWSTFKSIKSMEFDYLTDGRHVLEVRAMDSNNFVDSTPARVSFFVDTMAPDIGITVQDKTYYDSGDSIKLASNDVFKIDVKDNLSSSDNVRTAWRLNGGKWRPYYDGRYMSLPLARDRANTLSVRARDEFGNLTTQNFTLQEVAPESSWGCSAGNGSALELLLILMLPLVWRRRQVFTD